MKRILIFLAFLFIGLGVFAQSKHKQTSKDEKQKPIGNVISDIVNKKADSVTVKDQSQTPNKLILAKDTLTLSDCMLSIDRVNDDLNSVRDSINLGFEIEGSKRKIDDITNDVSVIRKNVRARSTVVSIKNLYLYQNSAFNLNKENDRIEEQIMKRYDRIYNAKTDLKNSLKDSIFRVLYADSSLRKTLETRLIRIEKKWNRYDSTAKVNIDTLNAIKIKVADNAINLSNILAMMDMRLDRADKQLFGREVNYLWQKETNTNTSINPATNIAAKTTPNTSNKNKTIASASAKTINSGSSTSGGVSSSNVSTKLGNEKNVIFFYFDQTARNLLIIFTFGILLLLWLYSKRKLLTIIRDPNGSFGFLHLHYLDKYPVLSVIVVLMCLIPLFDVYAPTSYITIEFLILLAVSSVIFFRKENFLFIFYWLILIILLVVYTLTYLLIEPAFVARLWLIALQVSIIVVTNLFYKTLKKDRPFYKGTKKAAITAIVLSALGILCNLFGRFSLSGILGISAVFAITQAVVLPVFIETFFEIVLVQLQSSRMKKGFDRPFDCSIIINKIKTPLVIVAIVLWFFMLSSNLNIYHGLMNAISNLMNSPFSIGNISFRLISLVYFFVIIWFAHILQQLISFLFGETGIENEDATPFSKKQHSRLLITRLLVLVGGYLLAIAASGLPMDKITILLGALGVGIGMGLQSVVNNFVSGIILIFDGSLKIGDEIEIGGQSGKLKELGLRASTLTTADGADVIVPNGNILSQNIVNWTFTNDYKRVVVYFILTGKELDANVINEVINDTFKNIPGVLTHKKPVILYTRVTPGNCTISVRFWSTINNADDVKSELMLKLNSAFADKNIEFG
jgi:potassium-dependent mechanosensitive channel